MSSVTSPDFMSNEFITKIGNFCLTHTKSNDIFKDFYFGEALLKARFIFYFWSKEVCQVSEQGATSVTISSNDYYLSSFSFETLHRHFITVLSLNDVEKSSPKSESDDATPSKIDFIFKDMSIKGEKFSFTVSWEEGRQFQLRPITLDLNKD